MIDQKGQLVAVPWRGPADQPTVPDVRRSDVDAWGRSDHFRALSRRIYDPIYKYWHRVEWENFDRLPAPAAP